MGKKRSYRQTRRAYSAAETRQRIVAAARAALTTAPLHNVSLDEIAARADVARSTIYTIFRSRAKLFEAVAEDVLTRGDFAAQARALSLPDPVAALETFLRASARIYATEHAVGHALFSLAALDRDVAGAARHLNMGRAENMRALAERMQTAGKLCPEVSLDAAGDILWLLTSFETFDQLYSGRGRTSREAGERLIMLAKRALCVAE